MNKTSASLATPRTGVGRLTRTATAPFTVSSQLGQLIAAWQTPEPGSPKRVVVRTDGILVRESGPEGAGGYPCAVLSVRYTIGGLKREVLVDPLKQNALALWAESVDVEPVWDQRRIDRIAMYTQAGPNTPFQPCPEQLVAAAITASATHGDSGESDARWIDVLALDFLEEGEETVEWSINPIPNGARGVRFLNGLVGGANFRTANAATFIWFSAIDFKYRPVGLIETAIDGSTDQSIILIPAGAQYLFTQWPDGTFAAFDVPPFIEWIISPDTLSGG